MENAVTATAVHEAPDQTVSIEEWDLKPSTGWQIPSALSVVFLALFTGSLVYLFSRPVALDSFAAGVVALTSLLIALVSALLGLGCYSARYRIDGDSLTLDWLWMAETIPLRSVDGLYSGQQLTVLPRVEGLSWPGHYLGRAKTEDGNWLKLFATSPSSSHILIVTSGDTAYVLTPRDLDEFRASLIEHLQSVEEATSEELPRPVTTMPRLFRLSILRDRAAIGFFALATALLAVSYGYISAKLPGLADLIPLHFNYAGNPNVIGPPQDAFRMPVIATAILILNGLAAAVLHERGRDTARLVAGATAFVALIALISVLKVVQ